MIALGGRIDCAGKDIKAAAESIKDQSNLTSVNLDNTAVSDAGLVHLKEIKTLI